ncbi:MAG: phosphatidylglycerophosphatase A [Acidobacteria bacterium]|nr:phosphatidylglycerophosphatase A [Acidobacteriota bacterium]
MKQLGVAIGTVAGVGYLPIAPGTWGSAVAVILYLVTRQWAWPAQLALLLVVTVVGIWASDVTAKALNREDPGPVVIDEVAGQLVTLFMTGAGLYGAIIGFFVFRIFDIIKPWPARQLEDLPGGVGIMADDLMAGVYGWVVVTGILWWWPGL